MTPHYLSKARLSEIKARLEEGRGTVFALADCYQEIQRLRAALDQAIGKAGFEGPGGQLLARPEWGPETVYLRVADHAYHLEQYQCPDLAAYIKEQADGL